MWLIRLRNKEITVADESVAIMLHYFSCLHCCGRSILKAPTSRQEMQLRRIQPSQLSWQSTSQVTIFIAAGLPLIEHLQQTSIKQKMVAFFISMVSGAPHNYDEFNLTDNRKHES